MDDRTDPLASFRDRFLHPRTADGGEAVYLCGNSLGLQPRTAAERLREELDDWATHGVHGHFEARRPWLRYHEFLAESGARLVGAQPDEVVHMNTLTVNLHLMMASFFRPGGARRKILIEEHAFPSDRYAVESQLRWHGLDPDECLIEASPREGEECLRDDDLVERIGREGAEIALILLPGVQYYTGQVLDMARLTEAGRAAGCAVGFDLAHAAGNIPLSLHDWGCDFACWCTYKYLNSGPGAIAGCFVHERHVGRTDLPRLAGWWGQDKATRFEMGPEFHPIPTAEGWQLSNPPVLALAPVLASLEIFDEAGMDALREKSVALTGTMESRLVERLADRVRIITPSDPSARGCQLSLSVSGGAGRNAFEALTAAGVVCDWREPDVIRVAPTPLYNRFQDVHRFVDILEEVLS